MKRVGLAIGAAVLGTWAFFAWKKKKASAAVTASSTLTFLPGRTYVLMVNVKLLEDMTKERLLQNVFEKPAFNIEGYSLPFVTVSVNQGTDLLRQNFVDGSSLVITSMEEQ